MTSVANSVAAWPNVGLGRILRKSENWVDMEPDREYAQVTVRLWGKGVVLRGRVLGREVAASRQVAVRGSQFILSRIDARNGAFGLVPPELDGALVSNDFPVFDVDSTHVMPEFLAWMSKTHDFVDLCRRASEGTTNRVRLKEDIFLATEIPLPPLDEQRRIVARIEELAGCIAVAKGLRREAMAETEAFWRSAQRQAFTFANSLECQWLTVEDSCEAIIDYRGRTPPIADAGIPHLTSSNIRQGHIDWNTTKFVTEETYLNYMTRGLPKPGVVDGLYLGWVITSPDVRAGIYARATGTTVKGIASKRLRLIALPIPPLQDQQRIVNHLDVLRHRIEAMKKLQAKATAELDALLPSVLDKAFRGSYNQWLVQRSRLGASLQVATTALDGSTVCAVGARRSELRHGLQEDQRDT